MPQSFIAKHYAIKNEIYAFSVLNESNSWQFLPNKTEAKGLQFLRCAQFQMMNKMREKFAKQKNENKSYESNSQRPARRVP